MRTPRSCTHHVSDIAHSWSRGGYDGGYFCCHAIRDYQVSIPSVYSQHTLNTAHRTKLIDDAKRPDPRYRGLIHGTVSIIREEGIGGVYRGLFPVVSPTTFSPLPCAKRLYR